MNIVTFFVLIGSLLMNLAVHSQSEQYATVDFAIENAIELTKRGDFRAAETQYRNILSVYPDEVTSLQNLGSLLMQQRKFEDGLKYLERALDLPVSPKFQSFLFLNYVEGLRAVGKKELAKATAERFLKIIRFHSPEDLAMMHFHMGKIEAELGNIQGAFNAYTKCAAINPNYKDCWIRVCELLMENGDHTTGLKYAQGALERFPNDPPILHIYGLALHHLKRVDDALKVYLYALQLDPNNTHVKVSIAAAYQGLGRSEEALAVYSELFKAIPNDSVMLNNLGALLGTMNRHDEEIYYLLKALQINPYLEQALTNIAGFYQDEGLLDDAIAYLKRIPLKTATQTILLSLRIATMMSPVSASWEQMVDERLHMEKEITKMIHQYQNLNQKVELDNSFDRIHFYISFHGLNDKYIQQLVGKAYQNTLMESSWMMPNLEEASLQQYLVHNFTQYDGIETFLTKTVQAKKRIGFISKFFGIFEPHGMLLDGSMKYLPRNQFEVICLPIARSDGKPVASILSETCDEIIHISLIHQHALSVLSTLRLDVLVFADFVSEPINHFLAFSRIAPIQIGFWGNPITSGSPNVDYYISAEVMEHPFRTRMPTDDDPYSEQVLLTEGQGIWYFRPVDPEIELAKVNLSERVGKPIPYERATFNLSDDWFIFLLPQSVFKIHPLYDYVLAEILKQNPKTHLVVTGGRRQLWTDLYRSRFQKIFGDDIFQHRVHIIERVSSENFYHFLELADVILHPFPFDGSRTSADALMVHKPYITLPTEYLRGRMGYSFLRTMNMPELVATDISHYIQIAGKLVNDAKFYNETVQKIKVRLDLIWEDMLFPYSITSFMQRLCGFPVSSYEEFLVGINDRDVDVELARSKEREENAKAFDQVFEKQLWQLDEEGKASLQAMIRDARQWPRIFEHWRTTDLMKRNISLPQHPDYRKYRNSGLRGFDLLQYVLDAIEIKNMKKAQRDQLKNVTAISAKNKL